MSREKKKQKKEELTKINTEQWIKFFDDKFNEHRKDKAMLLYTWYIGDSDMLTEAYVNLAKTNWNNSIRDSRNGKTYFWNVASQEADIKRTHSGLPKAITKTLINILDYPSCKVMKDVVNEEKEIESVESKDETERLEAILEDNDFENLVKQQQEPLCWVMGDGAYIVNIDQEISEYPIIEYVDARNVGFEIKANRITKVYTRSYFIEKNVGYCLLQERGTTILEDGNNTAYIKSNLFKLANKETRAIDCEVPLTAIEETSNIKPMIAIKGINEMLAAPCVYDYEPISERGTGLFNEKMDMLDDLDQCLSQDANCIRLSTPVETIDEAMLESDDNGNAIIPKRFDRRYVKVKASVNSVGENGSGITSSVPQIDFSRYSNEALAITSQILTGIISPCTIGADVSKKDNAEAQREKEKQTMFTRKSLIAFQTSIFKRLFNLVLKMDDVIHKKKPQEYDIVVDYEEYGNPTFDAKLQALYPPFIAGGMSAEIYVKELYGDSLTDDEKEREIAYLKERQNVGMSIPVDDPFADITE